MNSHLETLLELGLAQLARALHPGKVRVLGLAALGPPARFGTRVEVELLLVAEALPGHPHRFSWLETTGGLRLRLRWKSRTTLLYPSPLYLQVLERGAILYDPEGLLEASFRVLLERLAAWGLPERRAYRSPSWRGAASWLEGPLTPARPSPAALEREDRALAL